MKRQPEIVLLVEPHGDSYKLRACTITVPVNMFIERCHLDPKDPMNASKQWIRTWVNKDGERDETGRCRVFREELPPPEPEEKENPIYEEMVIKSPIPLTDEEARKA